MNEPWWLPSDETVRFASNVAMSILKMAFVVYVLFRLESIADAERVKQVKVTL